MFKNQIWVLFWQDQDKKNFYISATALSIDNWLYQSVVDGTDPSLEWEAIEKHPCMESEISQ